MSDRFPGCEAFTAFGLLLIGASLGLAGAVGPARAQTCPIDKKDQATNGSPGASCVITPGAELARITASDAGMITANGVFVDVPNQVAATARSGGAISFGVDPIAGGSTISGGGGTTGLDADGPGSRITAAGLGIALSRGGTVSAKAEEGGLITLNQGVSIQLQSGGAQGLWATGAGSTIAATGLSITGVAGGGDQPVLSENEATISLTDSVVTLGGSTGPKTALLAESGGAIVANGLALTVTGKGGDVGLEADRSGLATLTGGSVVVSGGQGGETALSVQSTGSILKTTDTRMEVTGAGGDTGVLAARGGAATLSGGSVSAMSASQGETGLLADGAGSSIAATNVQVSVPLGTGGAGVSATSGGVISLSGGAVVTGGAGAPALFASAGTITASGVQVSTTGAGAPAVVVQDGGALTFVGGEAAAAGAGSFGLLVRGAAGITNRLELDTVTVNASADALHVLGADANVVISGSTVSGGNGILLGVNGAGTATVTITNSRLFGVVRTADDSATNLTLRGQTGWAMTGSSNMTSLVNDPSVVLFAPPAGSARSLPSYRTLSVIDYVGEGGRIALNTYLGADGSPSDQLIIVGGSASGHTLLDIRNAGGPGARTVGNGILVVGALVDGTTALDAFTLNGEVRAGLFDYRLFRGDLAGRAPQDWFLRSTFVVQPPGGGGGTPPGGGGGTPPGGGGSTPPGGGGGTPPGGGQLPGEPIPPENHPPVGPTAPEEPGIPSVPGPGDGTALPDNPPPNPLPPGAYPIVGPELAVYGAVQPVAGEMGVVIVGTLHQRIGDTLTTEDPEAAAQGWGRSGWGRIFGEQVDNRYQTYVELRAKGSLAGIQAGVDIWRGALAPGHRDAAGLYFAYGGSALTVDGRIANAAATNYGTVRAGTVNLAAYALGAYWTHYGPSGWYLDAVAQGVVYSGRASTEFLTLPVEGSGALASLEGGYPIPLPLGPGFRLEPEGQILWQGVSFRRANDALGPVGLGSTSGATGRIGLRGQWIVAGGDGVVWRPYGQADLWRSWDGRAIVTFSETGRAGLRQDATQLELATGLTAGVSHRLSLHLQVGDRFALWGGDVVRRQSLRGDAGLRWIFG